ncbi:pyridoxamine 5'-phosphate oxidase [Kribbella qitaiheensis]|uniref:Pyridoxamine 5'-phosphate oxidase n=1 Tax=Kribbella qitaiheensis TaxID=1544730 RepID=A0A7G6X2J2_9ACTN|nr:pyridoxamine 5'-phosphate oxidase family protein [Kribbella qitaiheensis]QNE20457.1 pyridoxamine 5'-phosphate oxidase [Kribbella qitaiheensis]
MTSGFHEGELEVQKLAGVAHDAARLQGMLRPPLLDGGAAKFLSQREFAAITARDRDGLLWTSPLQGPAGFLEAKGTTLTVHATPPKGDPLHELPADQEVGLIVIEFAIRRRVRVNGHLTTATDVLRIDADQAYGNCPQYIDPEHRPPAAASTESVVTDGELGEVQAALIEAADTFFLGTTHPGRGVDTSHKGGTPGFVRIDGPDLWWPDYAGNNMFNSLGNIAVDPTTALLFIDFATGTTLHLTGTATIDWNAPPDESGTGRRVRFHPTRTHLDLRA